jgi:hypothetical protein
MTKDPWFRPRRYGWGAGWPRAWQGWAVLGGFLVLFTWATRLYPQAPVPAVLIGALSLGLLFLAVIRRTEGGVRWRWGNLRD